MARFARLVVPGYPHHDTQRGVRSMAIFADGHDRQTSLRYMAEEAERCGGTFLGWCMMTNHVHLITVPEQEDSLARALSTPIGAAYAGRISEPGYAATCSRGGSIPVYWMRLICWRRGGPWNATRSESLTRHLPTAYEVYLRIDEKGNSRCRKNWKTAPFS